MARVNVYLPDDLHDEVKSAGVEISAACQAALRAAVANRHRSKREQLDLLDAAKRLSLTARYGPLRKAEGSKAGRRWANEAATLADLERLGELRDMQSTTYRVYMIDPGTDDPWDFKALVVSSFETILPWLHDHGDDVVRPTRDGDRTLWQIDDYAQGFIEGAQEFWAEVRPLLEENEESREQRAQALRDALYDDEPPF